MNWYKKAQADIVRQYQQMLQQAASSIQIIGTGQNESISLPGAGKNITARELLEHVKMRLAPVLVENHVNKIDTSPISKADAQGLAQSDQPGTINVDVKKIFDLARGSLSSFSQLNGSQVNPDSLNAIVDQVAYWIEGELIGTTSHESFHSHQYVDAFEQNQPFTSVQESPAEQFEQKIRNQYK